MKTFNLSEISTTKRTEILIEARENGAILQKKNTNGEVLEEFLIIAKSSQAIWNLYQDDELNPVETR